jgi:hypothetical protein
MAGGLLNIISEGNNNVILTGNPTKTFFTVTYSKYTNFGLQKFRIDYDGQRNLRLATSSTFTFKITRNAELLLDTYLVVALPDIWSPIYPPDPSLNNNQWSPYDFRWIENIGTNLISEVVITCGNQTLQRYTGDYLAAMVNRDFDSEKKRLFNEMTGNVRELNEPANAFGRVNTYPSAYYTPNSAGAEPSIRGRNLYIPINTWFTLDSRCAFPLISLQYNELSIQVTLRPIQELFQVRDIFDFANNHPYVQPDFNQTAYQLYRFLQTPPSVDIGPSAYENTVSDWNADVHLLCTYCFLSKEEAKRFAKEDQMYLIKDVFTYNFQNITGTSRLDLTSSGMVSSWMWYLQRNDVNLRNEWSNYTNWPYRVLPGDITLAPQTDSNNEIPGIAGLGPLINPNNFNTGLFITGNFNSDNVRDILQTMGILLNGEYRENVMERGVYDYVEKYVRTKAFADSGLYCYNFCLNTSPFEYQPSGAINMSRFKNIQLEVSTFVPTIDPAYSTFNLICDPNGNPIGVEKSSWRLYEYNFNLTLFEERYNILTFLNGNAAMLYAR